ncbi:MAG: pyruvate synthase [Spirochaetes bacterium]|nr:MAG: pyruvate synthase [Spirochaetota bacterium]
MLEIRIHGRGGQGAVTSAELLAATAISKGKYAQAFPNFGPERRGAPVTAFCRISDERIYNRSKIYNPDIVIVLDAGLLAMVNPTEGMKDGALLIINTKKNIDDMIKEHDYRCRVATVDANLIAQEVLKRPIINTTMLGAFFRATGIFELSDIGPHIIERFGEKLGSLNNQALERAYNEACIKEHGHGEEDRRYKLA